MRKLPEAVKPRRIAIDAGVGNDHQQIEHSQAPMERPGRNPIGRLWVSCAPCRAGAACQI
jgi:hypothetical protein